MSAQVPKLIAVGFLKPQFDSSLDALESLLAFGFLSQLGRMMEVQTRDLTLSGNKWMQGSRLNAQEFMERLQKTAQANRVQYVWTGQLSYSLESGDSQAVIKATYWLYDAEKNQLALNDSFILPRRDATEPKLPPVALDDFNLLINQAAAQCRHAMLGGDCEPFPVGDLSCSLLALHWAMRASHALRHEEKISFYEKAIQEDAQMEVVHVQLARLYKNEQAYEKSVLCYREALKYAQCSMRNRAMYATEAGIACALLGRTELAMQWWLKAIDYDPTFLNPYFNLANSYEDQNNLLEAEKYFLQAQKLAPDDFRTYLNLARLYSKLGAWEKALEQYRRQLETEEDDPWCHSDVATCYLNLGDTQRAMAHLRKTVSLDPDGEAGQYAQLILNGMSLN
jgi:tetratricopeptide (TPR) repeat protein